MSDQRKPLFILSKCLFETLCDLADVLLTFLLLVCEYCLFHLSRRNDLFDRSEQLIRNCAALVSVLFFTALSNDAVDEFNDLLVYFVLRVP